MTNEKPDDNLPIKALLALVLFVVCLFAGVAVYNHVQSPEFCGCGAHGLIAEEVAEEPQLMETSAKRKLYKIWIAPGTVSGITESDFRKRIMAAFAEISSFTNADFVLVEKINGSHTRIYPATDEMMWKKWRDPLGLNRVPLGLQSGNWLYLTTRPRWSGKLVLEATVIHEMGHRFRLRYPQNKGNTIHSPHRSDIMHGDLPVVSPSTFDKENFQKKLGKKVSYRIDYKPLRLAA